MSRSAPGRRRANLSFPREFLRAPGALAIGLLTALAPRAAQAEVLARHDLFGREVRVERAQNGALSLVLAGEAPLALASGGTARVERVAVGSGAVLVVRVEGESPAAALVAGGPSIAPGVLFAGALRSSGEDVGERATQEIIVRDLDGDGAPDVVLAERRDDVRLCGVGSVPLRARAVSRSTLRLVPVMLNPLRADLYGDDALPPARALNAVAVHGRAHPLLPALAFTAGASGGLRAEGATLLSDQRDDTVWRVRERDLVNATVSLAGVPAERLVITAPPAPFVLPRSFTVLLEPGHQRLEVTVPAGVSVAPGARIAVPLVPAAPLRCVSLVVTDRSSTAQFALAELEVATPLDRDPAALDVLVRALEGSEGEQASGLLAALGPRGVEAVATALPSLGEQGARRAIRLLAAAHTPRAATALAEALSRAEVADEARAALQRFGPEGLDALAALGVTDPRAADLIVVTRAPLEARLQAMAALLAAEPATWRQVRGAALALVAEAAREGALEAWLSRVPPAVGPAARALSVAAEGAVDAGQRALVAARARTLDATGFEDRFRLLVPLAGDAEGRALVARVALEDEDADLRAEAVRALHLSGGAGETLVRALADTTPRVRIEAARGLQGHGEARTALLDRLAHDAWPTVRAAAATSLAGDAANETALATALDDFAVVTVRAALAALERTPSRTVAPRLMRFAEDPRRHPELRTEALNAIANRCDRGLENRLLALFLRQADPVLPPAEQAVGHAALAALAHIDPARARAEMRRLETNARGVAALERAMRNACPAR